MSDALLETLRHIAEVESHEYIWKDGEYKGCVVTYANPLHPQLKTVFYPYVPLMVTKALRPGEELTMEPWPKLTREYFLRKGLDVPGEKQTIN